MNNNQNSQEKIAVSRRGIAFGAGVAGLVSAAIRAQAQSTTPGSASDIAILNFALTLEDLEAAFYTQGLTRLTQADFNRADFASVLGPGTVAGVYSNLSRIRDHEVTHAQTLRTTITSLGGTPVQPCTYQFSYTNPNEFLQIGMTLEETGVQAYDGAIGMVQSAAIKRAGASIATVEARHAAYLSLLVSAIPFPRAFDQTKTMQEILAIARPFLGNCPTPPGTSTTTAVLMPKNLSTAQRQIALDASMSTSADGQPLKYMLRSVSNSAAITQADTATPMVQFSAGFGDYTFELTVTDSTGATATDRTTIRYVGN